MNEFMADKVERQSAHIAVRGAVNAGLLRVGTGFTHVSQKPRAQAAADDLHPVSLVIVRITAYGRDLDQLPEGMTGELHLSGTGFEAVVDGTFLSD